MSCRLFIHDFFQDGRLDALSEVRILQHVGLWTKEKRKRLTKEAVAVHSRLKHDSPHMCEAIAYFAGRVIGLKSAIVADFPTLDQETHGKMVFLPLTDEKTLFCGNCGDKAAWKYYERGNESCIRYRCDCCKQEQVRIETAYIIASGWDWDEDEEQLLPLPVPQRETKEDVSALEQTVIPLAYLTGVDLYNVMFPVNHESMILELVLVALVCWQRQNIVRFLFFLSDLMEGKHELF